MNADYEFDSPSDLSECGVVTSNDDGTAGMVNTDVPYAPSLQCTWNINTNCSSLQWRFVNFSIEDATDSYDNEYYYNEYYGEDHTPKWWICSFDHVQVFYGSRSSGRHTSRLCQWDTDYNEGHAGLEFMTGDHQYYLYEDNDPHISNPRSLGYMIWTKIPDSSLVINFQTDGQIRSSGFALEWKCANSVPDRCENAQFNTRVIRAIQSAFDTDKGKYTRNGNNQAKDAISKLLSKIGVKMKN